MLLRAAFNFIIYSNIWISLGAVSYAVLYFQYFDLPIDFWFLGFIFTATLFTYNFQRLVKLRFNMTALSGYRFTWIETNRKLVMVLTILSAATCAVLSYGYTIRHWYLLAVIGFFSFFYVWQLPFSKYNLRSVPTIKIYLVSITWVFTCILLPHLEFGNRILDQDFLLFAVSMFLFILAITIPFDIRDVEKDEAEKKTIPQLMGVQKAKVLAIMLFVLAHAGLSVMAGYWHPGLTIHAIFGSLVLYYTEVNRSDNYFSGLTDGLLISLLVLFNVF